MGTVLESLTEVSMHQGVRPLPHALTQTAGLNMHLGAVGDMKALGVREAFKSKLQVTNCTEEARKRDLLALLAERWMGEVLLWKIRLHIGTLQVALFRAF